MIKNPVLWLLSSFLFAPFLLYAGGYIDEVYLVAGLVLVAYLILLVVNFEAGFLVLVFIRSSLDYVAQLSEAGSFNVAALATMTIIVLGIFYIIYRKVNIFRYEEAGPFLIFIFFSAISLYQSTDLIESVSDWLRLWSALSVYLLTRILANSLQKTRRIFMVILMSSLIPLSVACYQHFSGSALIEEDFGRLMGTFSHPNAFATYLVLMLAFCIAQVFEKQYLVSKKVLLPLVLISMILLVMTFSRGAWIVFVFILTFMGLFRYRKVFLLIPVGVALLIFTMPMVLDRIYGLFDPSYTKSISSWEWRMETWSELFPLFLQKPFFGHGLGMVNIEMGFRAHNDYLRLLVESGAAGFLSYLYLTWVVVRKTWIDYRGSSAPLVKSLNLGLLAVLFGFLVRQLADNTLRHTVVLMYLWMFVALARSAAIFYKKNPAGEVS